MGCAGCPHQGFAWATLGGVARPFRSFVALGDSLTEGVGDPLPGGELRGWADRLAEGLRALNPDLAYAKLARRSLVAQEILETQLPAALELEPDLAGTVVGMNDAIHPGFDVANVAGPLDELVAALQAAGATVLNATLPDVTRLLPIPPGARLRVRAKLEAINEVVREVSRRRRTVLVDAEDFPEELHSRNWSLDRLHPNSRGHLLIAMAFAAQLEELRGVEIPMPEPGDVRRLGLETARHARWMVGHVAVQQARRIRARLPGRREVG
jgi:lysophospholipase L1-like esterase